MPWFSSVFAANASGIAEKRHPIIGCEWCPDKPPMVPLASSFNRTTTSRSPSGKEREGAKGQASGLSPEREQGEGAKGQGRGIAFSSLHPEWASTTTPSFTSPESAIVRFSWEKMLFPLARLLTKHYHTLSTFINYFELPQLLQHFHQRPRRLAGPCEWRRPLPEGQAESWLRAMS